MFGSVFTNEILTASYFKKVTNGGRCDRGVWFHIEHPSQPRPSMFQIVWMGSHLTNRKGRSLHDGCVKPDDSPHPVEEHVLRLHLPFVPHLVALESKRSTNSQTSNKINTLCIIIQVHLIPPCLSLPPMLFQGHIFCGVVTETIDVDTDSTQTTPTHYASK